MSHPEPVHICECHGEEMFYRARDGYRCCRIKKRERNRRTEAKRRANGRHAETLANQVARGEQIQHWGNHHLGMAALKARLGDPRPVGLTLSLVNWDSPDAYWGYRKYRGERKPHRLSTNPDDYVWETHIENHARRKTSHG